ncbi:hypothetical protein EDD18DRAFT_1463255 [Armillaria luteobubalina]|uniref:Uncharacterized protein n=1 Tax=Armillaria luteobubalina TaxID=153913 RepID=A0AA39Q6I6_9AGAR|nr:hypothetical protein EDD18DRAFT_1463255 [Armillaria luteobubalina]
MMTQIDVSSDLPDDDKTCVFQDLDALLNSLILNALLCGIYTGILVVTLRNIFINTYWPIRRTLVFVIVLLHVLIILNFAFNWSHVRSAFIENGRSFRTIHSKFDGPVQAMFWERGLMATISTIVADIYIIWCCWMVWGRRWVVVLLPTLSLISATVSTLCFQTPSELCTTGVQETTRQSTVLDTDIEAHPEPLVVFVEKTQRCS